MNSLSPLEKLNIFLDVVYLEKLQLLNFLREIFLRYVTKDKIQRLEKSISTLD